MRLLCLTLLAGLVALCALQPCQAMPHVMSAGGGTMLVVREETDVEQRVSVNDIKAVGEDEDDTDQTEFEYSRGLVVDLEDDVDADDVEDGDATQPPPPEKCRLRKCWKSCARKRHYNWGLCICNKCRCFP